MGSDTGGKGGSSGNLLCKAEKFPREGVETRSRWGGGVDVGMVHFGDKFAAEYVETIGYFTASALTLGQKTGNNLFSGPG